MDPFQLLRADDLLGPKRPSDEDIRIENFFRDTIVIFKLHDFHVGEFVLQAFADPGRSMPKLETVVMDYQDLHY